MFVHGILLKLVMELSWKVFPEDSLDVSRPSPSFLRSLSGHTCSYFWSYIADICELGQTWSHMKSHMAILWSVMYNHMCYMKIKSVLSPIAISIVAVSGIPCRTESKLAVVYLGGRLPPPPLNGLSGYATASWWSKSWFLSLIILGSSFGDYTFCEYERPFNNSISYSTNGHLSLKI